MKPREPHGGPQPDRVSRIDLKVGFRCNNHCRFCVQGDKRDRLPDKTTAEVCATLVEARSWADEVVFTGGEATVRADLPELIEHARDLGYRLIQLQTNGRTLGNPRAVTRLVEAGVTEFSPALHGPGPAVHDHLTGSEGSFRQTVRGIRNVKRLGLPILLNSVVTRANTPHLPAMAALCVALEVDQFQLAFVHALGTAAVNFEEIVPRLGRVAPLLQQALSIGQRAGVRVMTEAVPLCFLGEYRHLAAEWILPRARIYDADKIVEDYTALRLSEGKAKGDVCQRCALEESCEGPWREYPEHFGWGEFEPIDPVDE